MFNEYEVSPFVKSLSLKGGETVPNDVDSIYSLIAHSGKSRLAHELKEALNEIKEIKEGRRQPETMQNLYKELEVLINEVL